MDLSLTDVLACPHCGPPYALILLADAVAERRVLAGTLGCANCYRRYRVREGLADLRPAPEPLPEPLPATTSSPAASAAEATVAPPASGVEEGSVERAFRLAALMGLSDASGSAGRAVALVAGPAATEAAALAEVAEEYQIVAAGAGAGVAGVAGLAEEGGVSRILVAGRLPFFDGSLRGVALSGEAAELLLEEGVRVLNPMGRLVVDDAPPGAAERIAAAGGRVVAAEGSTVVAVSLRALSVGP